MNMEMITATTINERTTSHLFQLARLEALSDATVVAKVNPFSWSSEGLSLVRLTPTITSTENTKR